MNVSTVVAYVTGAGSGLGKATAKRLASLGARVCLVDATEKVFKVAEEIGAANAFPLVVDVSNENAVEDSVKKAMDHYGKINVNVNCAGICHVEPIMGENGVLQSTEQFMKIINVNTVGTFNTLKFNAREIAKNSPDKDGIRGVIINTSSIAGYDAFPGLTAYCASKGAINGMTLPIAKELAPFGIRVNTIAPGVFQTPMIGVLPDQSLDDIVQQIPLPKRSGDPDEFAQLVQNIIENSMFNGSIIRLDAALHV